MTKKLLDEITYEIIGAAIEVHRELGPGLLESVYELCLGVELQRRFLKFERQKKVPIVYKDIVVETELRVDFVVENWIPVELKAVETVNPISYAQLLTYMRLLKLPKGILINFNCTNIFRQGQKTIVNDLYAALP